MDKKKFRKIVIAGIILGLILSFIIESGIFDEFGESFRRFLLDYIFIILIGSIVILIGLAYFYYKKGKEAIKRDLESDDVIDNTYTNRSMKVYDLGNFIVFSMLPIWALSVSIYNQESKMLQYVGVIIGVIAYIYFASKIFSLNYAVIKTLEPNRKVDPLDFKFNNKFIEESDERVRADYYKKGYKGYMAILLTNFILLAILSLMAFNGNIPISLPICLGLSSIVGILASK